MAVAGSKLKNIKKKKKNKPRMEELYQKKSRQE